MFAIRTIATGDITCFSDEDILLPEEGQEKVELAMSADEAKESLKAKLGKSKIGKIRLKNGVLEADDPVEKIKPVEKLKKLGKKDTDTITIGELKVLLEGM